ncbi:uncharacterized protein LOC129288911 [Prosopis cineraria]|uniref:uncharacterized protein LOC129288911 n=1 Tax=Prosopis cineraria TaxID=364024 RepID=UPI00240ED6CC|nr:uncharacterized protein LOC129288911 [Prosopis cineraria]
MSCCCGSSLTNFERFLQRITPVVPSKTVSQNCISDLNALWQPLGKDTVEYFTLKDLWDCYKEWSAFGAGTNVMLESGDETVMQFFVPYLSSIHIYSDKSVVASRNRREEGDGVEFESDSWSDDSGSDNLSQSLSNNSSKSWDAVSEESCDQDGSWPRRDRLGYHYLQYTEMSSPYQRVPLVEKIAELARSHPALMTLKSVDLSPASWMAVAWYPIYAIPSVKNEKDLETCFLTYHTLSSSFQDNMKEYEDIELGKGICCCGGGAAQKELVGEKMTSGGGWMSVPPFGAAAYKMQGDIWVNPDSCDSERLTYLYSAADSWLRQLNLHHHDFNFFTSHSSL